MRPNAPWFWTEKNGWYVKVSGKRYLLAKGKENKKQAVDVFHRLMVDVKGDVPPAHNLQVKELCDLFLEHTQKHNTAATFEIYRYYLQSFCDGFGTVAAKAIKPFHISTWLDLHPAWQGSRRHAVEAIKRCYSWACAQGLLDHSPIKGVAKPAGNRRERILSAEEKTLILDSIRCERFKEFVVALLETGCRPSEVAKVTANDVSVEQGIWILKKHKTVKKTNKPRIVYLSPLMLEVTKRLVQERPEGSLFVGRYGQTYTRNAIRCHFRKLREKHPCLQGVVAYTCRHTYATQALVNGVGVAQVAELLGHSSVEMVSRHYGHLAQRTAHMREAAARAVGT